SVCCLEGRGGYSDDVGGDSLIDGRRHDRCCHQLLSCNVDWQAGTVPPGRHQMGASPADHPGERRKGGEVLCEAWQCINLRWKAGAGCQAADLTAGRPCEDEHRSFSALYLPGGNAMEHDSCSHWILCL